MGGIAHGSPDGPKYIHGKLNINHQASTRASQNPTSGSMRSALNDFSHDESPKISADEADLDTALKDIAYEEYGEPTIVNEDTGMEVTLSKYDDDVTMEYSFDMDPRNTIISLMDYDLHSEPFLEFDPYADEDIISDEYFDAYEEAMNNFAEQQGLYLDNDIIESDFSRATFSSTFNLSEDDNDDPMTVGNMHDRFNGVYNAMTYRIPDSVRSDFEHGLSQRGVSVDDIREKIEKMKEEEEEEF